MATMDVKGLIFSACVTGYCVERCNSPTLPTAADRCWLVDM